MEAAGGSAKVAAKLQLKDCKHLILELGRLRQKDHEFKSILGYVVRFGLK